MTGERSCSPSGDNADRKTRATQPEGVPRAAGEQGLILYFVAMAFHFVALRHSLRYEFTERDDRGWGWTLAAACLVGWLASAALGVSPRAMALLLGFLSGMLIMNTTVMELPSEKEGRFTPFVLGSLLYAILLAIA